ncbi:hypothetical protein R50072_01290 [Simiduia litorea]|uniref:sel1 repeat family protein n=1 Tax=Simiduia litorea TaxID=1435348 RepID=UPI0036F274C7
MNYLIAIFFIFLSAASFAKEECDPDSVGLNNESSDIEKYFYTGTCHYRNKEYSLSVESWEKLVPLASTSAHDEELKVDVLNNLGYMKFFGFGTDKDQEGAISYWQKAILLGHYEAEFHLCHAYADEKEITYDLSKARKHCEKARLIYKGKDNPDPDITSSIEYYIEKIGS